MIYSTVSLNGTWEMEYSPKAHTETAAPTFRGTAIENCVPGYWEDMSEVFEKAGLSPVINPQYNVQSYPIRGTAPDMLLPNFLGNFLYRRSFSLRSTQSPCVIHFDGVQNTVAVWLNGSYIGQHEGYSAPFDLEIPSGMIVDGENEIILSVSNFQLIGNDGQPVSGLTNRAVNACTGGITGNVELRFYTCPLRDATVLVSDDCSEIEVRVSAVEPAAFHWSVWDGVNQIKNGVSTGNFSFAAEGLDPWAPDHPKLYRLEISCCGGKLSQVFGLRRLTVDGVHLKLNGVPFFLRGICEHCYYPDSVHPTNDISFYRNVIQKIKALGFNFIRFHTHIPPVSYMDAADEMGILLHVECPNNTTLEEWTEIVAYCSKHPSVVIYCCGNELMIDEPFIDYLRNCADVVHKETDALFSPMSALRGLEYFWSEPGIDKKTCDVPFKHHPERFQSLGRFSDVYSSYHAKGLFSYDSMNIDCEEFDRWSDVYGKPRITHEICIDGTYTDLSLKPRYKNLRIGKTDYFDSIERHLSQKGILDRAPAYFENSSQWQRRNRKYCFEAARRCDCLAGFDFLGPIDTHWHTFGYDVGMMNEFYELKPGETERNVRMYNSDTVLLTDLGKNVNYYSADTLSFGIYVSHYGKDSISNGCIEASLTDGKNVIFKKDVQVRSIENGTLTKVCMISEPLPEVKSCQELRLRLTLRDQTVFAENEWEIYIYPRIEIASLGSITVSQGMSADELTSRLSRGEDVLILGTSPFSSIPTSFKIGLAGRTAGNYATVINDHPAINALAHNGYCGWQFSKMLENGAAIVFASDDIPFQPIIDIASSHKYVIRQSALFEFNVFRGRLVVCSLNFEENDPAAQWLKANLIAYMQSDLFHPEHTLSSGQFEALLCSTVEAIEGNKNFAFNENDITAVRKKKD